MGMRLKPSQLVDLARIRNNQRKSRARRKDYLHGVEERLRRFEQRGVEASIELQSAARLVADENTQLRSLLKSHGVTEFEVNEFLQNNSFSRRLSGRSYNRLSTINDNSAELVKSTVSPLLETTRELPAPTDRRPSSRQRNYDEHIGLSEQTEVTSEVVQDKPQSLNSYSDSSSESNSMPEMSNATSCMVAATIIAGMRDDRTSEEISAELGCPSGTDCKVNNVTIFEIMDR